MIIKYFLTESINYFLIFLIIFSDWSENIDSIIIKYILLFYFSSIINIVLIIWTILIIIIQINIVFRSYKNWDRYIYFEIKDFNQSINLKKIFRFRKLFKKCNKVMILILSSKINIFKLFIRCPNKITNKYFKYDFSTENNIRFSYNIINNCYKYNKYFSNI